MGSRIKDIGSKDLKGMLDLAWCRGALGLSISVIIMVILESKLGFNMYGKSIKNGPKVGSGGVLGALGSSWDALGSSGWVLGGIFVDSRSFWESFLEPFSLKNRLCFASFFTYSFGVPF